MTITSKLGEPHLFGEEHKLFRRCIDRGDLRYLEFGGGGSTLVAVRRGGVVVTVESDVAWVKKLRTDPEIAAAVANQTAAILHGDIGPTKELGYPADRTHADVWPAYIGVAWAEWARRRAIPNLVYVDGRFRVACCLSVLVALGPWRGTGEMPHVLLHDFDGRRPYYRPVLEYFDIVETVETLIYLQPRPASSPLKVTAMMLAYLSDPR
jgi:hypothetical protein